MNYFEQLKEIRESYKFWRQGDDPYSIYDWFKIWTPIERNVWGDIRYLGLPFYPQFPVDKYFIDFADPIKQIGIEVDGKEWHRDKEKDENRQKVLEELGWTIIRIQGKTTFRIYEDYFTEDFYDSLLNLEEEDAQEQSELLQQKYFIECSEGILRKLKIEIYSQI